MSTRGREEIVAIVAAHKELTAEVVQAARLMAAAGYGAFAAHLDQHRAELNVAVGEFAVWAESFGAWAKVDASWATYPPATTDPRAEPPTLELENDLRRTRDALLARRTAVLATLAGAREALRVAGLPVDQLTAYRRVVRLWTGEAVDVVTEVHRLAVADRYLGCLGLLSAEPDTAAAVLRLWMQELQEADREGELAFAETCGYGHLVKRYRSNH